MISRISRGAVSTSGVAAALVAAWRRGASSGWVAVRRRAPRLRAVPPLSEIRDAVHAEWANDARQQAKAQLYAGLLARYSVTVEGAPGTGG